MARNVEGVGARNRADVKFLLGEIRCRQPRFLRSFKGVFYGTGCHRPFRVPIPVMDGVKRVPKLSDLYVNYWVQQRNLDAVICTRQHLQHTFNSVPHSTMELDGLYTVFFERSEEQAIPNRLLERMACMTGRSTALNSSILVVKQSLANDGQIIDMTRDDMLVSNFIINRLSGHDVDHSKFAGNESMFAFAHVIQSATVASNFPVLASSPTLKPQSAEELASNTPPAEEATSTHVMLDQDDYEPYNISDFGAPNELLPFTSTPAAATTSTSSLTTNHVPALVSESHATHKDLGSGFPQGLQAFRSTP
ncbi:hypothetical protein EV702DRAFT_1221802 [Suillus placidus]|uniref:Uncharacterized protein n=1 Tax=Suillus placidus TaxID=48579 RepID=A0A9P6ZY87_9AGAM|nr:hypothetical protein EV702DRAFT_1221802 [Suillus placidus]